MAVIRKNCSIRDVADRAQVSASTVSRILSGRMGNMRVSESTRREVLTAAKALGYEPNINAKRLFSQRSNMISMLLPSLQRMGGHVLDNGHLNRIVMGMEEALAHQDYGLQLFFNNDEFERQERYLSVFRRGACDGLLIWGANDHQTYWDKLVEAGYPCIFLANLPPTRLTANFVMADYESGSYQLTRYLLERGHRRFAWIGGLEDISLTRLQRAGMARALGEAGIDFEQQLQFTGDFSPGSGTALAEQLLARHADFSAVISANDGMASGVYNYLTGKGIAIPEKVGIVSCDSLLTTPDEFGHRLPAFKVDDMEIGRQTIRFILKIIENPQLRIQKFCEGKIELYQNPVA